MAQLTGTKVLFSDNFTKLGPGNKLDAAKWGINEAYYGNNGKSNPAYLGDITLMRQELPKAESGTARIRLDTWNADWKNGASFYGSEAITKDAWDAQSTGGVAFQAKMKFEGTQGGMIAGLFFYEKFGFPPSPSDPRVPHNELDWEILTSQLRPSSNNKISTNVFTHGPGTEKDYPKSWPVKQIPNFSPNDWHIYRVEWLPTKVIWSIDGKTIRTEQTHLPQASVKQQLHLNLWGVPTSWGPSAGDMPPVWPTTGPNLGDPNFVPAKNANPFNATTNPSGNKTYYFDVQDVKVEQLSTRLGNSAANSLVGSASNDGIDGGDGSDTLNGMAGDDTIWGGAGNDTILGGDGSDTIDGESGNDYLYAEGGDDTLIGAAAAPGGANQLWGGAGNDTVSHVGTIGAVYADLGAQAAYVDGVLVDQMDSIENLTGGSGTNTLVGNDGANVLTGGDGNDYLYGRGGDDTLIGAAAAPGGANQLWGGAGNDTVSHVGTIGTVYADLGAQAAYVDGVLVDQMDSIENLIGGSNADTLVGDGGANRLTGGGGADALWGKGGADGFVYTAYTDSNLVTGYDTIADFVSGTSKLDLSAFATDAAHVLIQSDAQSTSLYLEKNPGSFDASTDLAISFQSVNAVTVGDIKF